MPDLDPDNIPVLNDIIDDDKAPPVESLRAEPGSQAPGKTSHDTTADTSTGDIDLDEDNGPGLDREPAPDSALISDSDIDEQDNAAEPLEETPEVTRSTEPPGHPAEADHEAILAALNQPYRPVLSTDDSPIDELAGSDEMDTSRDNTSIGKPTGPDEDILDALNRPYRPDISIDDNAPGKQASANTGEQVIVSSDATPDTSKADAASTHDQTTHHPSIDETPVTDTTAIDRNVDHNTDIEAMTERITRKIMPQLELQLKLIVRHALTDSLKNDDK